MSKTAADKKVAFLNLLLGGSGGDAGRFLRERHECDGRPYVTRLVHVDTDPVTIDGYDRSILIPLDDEKAAAIESDPESFGPTASAIVRRYREFLHPEDISNGSRTIRSLTQLAFDYHRDMIGRALRDVLLDLMREGGFVSIIPVFGSSSAGGAGSALQVLLALALQDDDFRRKLTGGLNPGVLRTPVGFFVEPFAHALPHGELHVNRLFANAFACRMETALLEQLYAFKYVFHLGLANSNGAVLDSLPEVAQVLGTAMYEFERHWPHVKARLVDTVDVHAIRGRYSGRGTWEDYQGNGQQRS